MITAKMTAKIELDMELKDYVCPDVPNIESRLKEELLDTLRKAIGEDEVTENYKLQSNIEVSVEVKEQKEERGNE